MYVLAPNQSVQKFPYSIGNLRKDNPQTSFPRNPSLEALASFWVFPVVSTVAEYDPTMQTAEQSGCVYNEDNQRWETTWIVRDLTQEELAKILNTKISDIRIERNSLLDASDWTQVIDAPVDQTAWAEYRQALRDITSQEGFPHNVVWPVKP